MIFSMSVAELRKMKNNLGKPKLTSRQEWSLNLKSNRLKSEVFNMIRLTMASVEGQCQKN